MHPGVKVVTFEWGL